MRNLCCTLMAGLVGIVALSACASQPATPIESIPSSTSTATPQPQRGSLLRIAIPGEVTTTNVWALFDEEAANYWNYATQNDYWPRLYHFSPLTSAIAPAAVEGEAPPVVCGPTTCSATVTLLPGLTWTDGTPLTAQDVAFTANTAMRFRLSLTWREAYNPEILDSVEALNDRSIKYSFKKPPSVSAWQYGVLGGPIVNQAYWQPRIVEAIARLPEDALAQSIQELQGQALEMQAQVENLGLSINSMAPASQIYQDTEAQAARIQDDLNSVNNKLEKVRNEYELKMAEARQELFALGNASEPTLGPWRFSNRISGSFENTAELGTPFGDPWFDKVRYVTVADEFSAVELLLENEVDVILSTTGLSPQSVVLLNGYPEVSVERNNTREARFLAFNHDNHFLGDVTLHKALACLIASEDMIENLQGEAALIPGFTLGESWQGATTVLPCQGKSRDARFQEAVRLLKSAGYSWEKEPANAVLPSGIKAPDDSLLPPFKLLAPAQDVDSLRASAAAYIVEQARLLGINVEVNLGSIDSIQYAVYGSGEYDMALLGWRLSSYPAYLCTWFTPVGENPFSYSQARLLPVCEEFNQATSLLRARALADEIQAILLNDLPLIPLYVSTRYDAYRNVRFPFAEVLDGLAGVYGAPVLTLPIR